MDKRIETVELRARDIGTGFDNPRKITKKKREELRKSLELFGDFGVFVIDENNDVIAGNQRLSIIKEIDDETMLLCKRLIGYSDAEKRAINIRDNTHSGDWDLGMLADWTSDLTIDLGISETVKKDIQDRKIKEMEPIAYEKYDYVIIACRNRLDYDELTQKLGLRDRVVKITKDRDIKARAVWYENVRNIMF